MKGRHRSIRIFENPFLERLTHVHPIVPLLIWAPVSIFFIVHSSLVRHVPFYGIAGLGLAGLLAWTLLEYLLHRFLFHMPTHGAFAKRLQFIIHGLHHEDPVDPTRLVMPPAAGIILATLLFYLFKSCLGAAYVEPFFGFFLIGYLGYDYTHYFVHHRIPKNTLAKKIRSYHFKHHFSTPDARWGVSTPLWDFVFGTMGPKEVAQNATSVLARPSEEASSAAPTEVEIPAAATEESYLQSNVLR